MFDVGGQRRLLLVLALATQIAVVASVGSRAEVIATQDSIINFNSRIIPRVLPRSKSAPVAIQIEGHLKPRKGRRPAPLRKIELGIHRAAALSPRGIPACDISSIDPASSSIALAACPGSRIGYGHVRAESKFPGQPRFFFNGRVVLFNGRLENGHPAILVHVFHARPPSSFVVPFKISRRDLGLYGTMLTASVQINRWSRITDFKLVLKRTFRQAGRVRSFLNASCPAPKGFSVGFSPFVQATLTFGNGAKSRIAVVSSCRVGR